MIKMEIVPEFVNVRIAAFVLDKATTSMQYNHGVFVTFIDLDTAPVVDSTCTRKKLVG